MKKLYIDVIVGFFLILVINLFYSCCGIRHLKIKNTDFVDVNKASFNMSPNTKLFFNKLNEEIKENDTNLKAFTPTGKVIDDLMIIENNNGYYIRGIIKTNMKFNKDNIKNPEIILTHLKENIFTVTIPLYLINDFLNIENIEYFEISEKTESK